MPGRTRRRAALPRLHRVRIRRETGRSPGGAATTGSRWPACVARLGVVVAGIALAAVAARASAAGASAGAAGAGGASAGGGGAGAAAAEIDLHSRLACDGIRDDRQALAALLAEHDGTGPLTLRVPSGCRIGLSSPGPGGVAVSLRSRARLVCDDPLAPSFQLAATTCDEGAFAGSVCDPATSCRSGACRSLPAPGGAEAAFAPQADAPYTVIGAPAGATEVQVIGCRFDLAQTEPFARCEGGPQAGWPCREPGDCAPEGACTGAPRPAAGPGLVRAVDLLLTADSRIQDVTVVHAGPSDRVLSLGARGTAIGNSVSGAVPARPEGKGGPRPRLMLVLGEGSIARENRLDHGDEGLALLGDGGIARDNRITDTRLGLRLGNGGQAHGGVVFSADGGTGVVTGDRAIVGGIEIHGGALGLELGRDSLLSDCTVSDAATGVQTAPGTTVSSNRIRGYTRLGIDAAAFARVSGNELSTDRVRSGPDPSIGIGVRGNQILIAGNVLSAPGFAGIRRADPFDRPFNVSVVGNRFVSGVGPAVVTSGAGWQVLSNYVNLRARGFCSDSRARDFLSPCRCSDRQCRGGEAATTGLPCEGDAACPGGRCVTLGSQENPYGEQQSARSSCRAVGAGPGSCDPDSERAACVATAALVVGEDGTVPEGRGAGPIPGVDATGSPRPPALRTGSVHVQVAANIVARGGLGGGQTGLALGDARACGGDYTPRCRGSGGNAGSACAKDADCTSTGCPWGDGHCCPLIGRVCASDEDCDQPDDERATCSGLEHEDLSVTGNYFYTEWQAIDASLRSAGHLTRAVISANSFAAGEGGLRLPLDPGQVDDLVLTGNAFGTIRPGRQLENFAPSMGTATSNQGLPAGAATGEGLSFVNRDPAGLLEGQPVEAAAGPPGEAAVQRASPDPDAVLGVVADRTARQGGATRVLASGFARCRLRPGAPATAAGDRLRVAPDAPGFFSVARPTDEAIAVAFPDRVMPAASPRAELVRCLLERTAARPAPASSPPGPPTPGPRGQDGKAPAARPGGRRGT